MEINGIEIHKSTIVHMLGYLDAKKFVDAIKEYPYLKTEILALAQAIDDAYWGNLVTEIEEWL